MARLASALLAVGGTKVIPTNVATATASGGDSFVNDDRRVLAFTNAHASQARTVTVHKQQDTVRAPGYGTVSISDITITVPALGSVVRRIPALGYADGSGLTQMTYSSNANLTVAVLELAR